MNLKSYEQYLNEDLSGEYNYYGPGSLFPIVQKLKQEGKSSKVIYVYLTSLGIDEDRKQKVISQVFMNESLDFETMQNDLSEIFEASLFEEGDKPSPDEINDLLNADPKDLAKGIDPKKAKPDVDFKKSLDKLKDKTIGDKEGDEPKEEPKSDAKNNIDALQAVLKDAEKLEKIREILKESRLNEATSFKNTKNFEDFLEEIDGMSEPQIRKIMGNDYIDTPGMYSEEKDDYAGIEDYMKSNMGSKDFDKLKSYWEKKVKK